MRRCSLPLSSSRRTRRGIHPAGSASSASRPSSSRAAASSQRGSTASSSGVKRPSTYEATVPRGGRETPRRKRAKSRVPRLSARDFSPWWPASPPPKPTPTSAKPSSISSCTASSSLGPDAVEAGHPGDALPAAVHVGQRPQQEHLPSAAGQATRAPAGASAHSPWNFSFQDSRSRKERWSMSRQARLWRVRACSGPGLPRKTTRRIRPASRLQAIGLADDLVQRVLDDPVRSPLDERGARSRARWTR